MLQFYMKKTIDKEQYLIDTLQSPHIGDDAALIGDKLYSMDAFFEDVHFKRTWMNMSQIGHKAMMVNLSDAIAMNATPQYALVSVSIPPKLQLKEIEELTQSLQQTAKEYGCEIIGGDTIGGDKLHLSITIISQSDTPLLRKNVQIGDYIAHTGLLGESKRDLEKLLGGETIADSSRFYRPKLRLDFIKKSRKYLHAGMDISDGLFCDTNKLLALNKQGFESLKSIEEEQGYSGEEYEMLVTFPQKHYAEIMKVAKETKTPLTCFAKVVQNKKRFPCKSHHF